MTALRLKEDPREWRTFSLALAGSLLLLGLVLGWRGGWGRPSTALLILAGILAAGAILRPQWMRPVYRLGMRVGHALGQVVGAVLLGVCFVVVVVPVGWLLRVLGRDLLRLRRDPQAKTYWEPARPPSDLERMF